MKSLYYEILRRDDGVIALSANAGQIDFTPAAVTIEGNNLVLEADTGKAVLANLSADALDYLRRAGEISFFEFSTLGAHAAHRLVLREGAQAPSTP